MTLSYAHFLSKKKNIYATIVEARDTMMIMSTIRTTFLLSLLAMLFVMIGNVLGGQLGMIIALLFSMVMIWRFYWHAKEVSQAQAPELYAMVGRLAERT